MIIDCQHCPIRGRACRECIVPVVLGAPQARMPLDAAERRAVSSLLGAGLIARSEARAAWARPEPRGRAVAAG